jgi:DNA (cytosine-5)-methyltransferase 1
MGFLKLKMNLQKSNKIGIIDIFAGPGGLSEGFASFSCRTSKTRYKILLSIEKEPISHKTLELRSFYRQFDTKKVPIEYYMYLRNEINRNELFNKFIKEAGNAENEAWLAELGSTLHTHELVDKRIINSLNGLKDWVLIGGPPCQAYSLVGRARMKNDKSFKNDPRHYLYKEYLRILAKHAPPVFVMENVKGLLSSKGANNERIFDRIINDLSNPLKAVINVKKRYEQKPLKYNIYSFVKADISNNLLMPSDYVVKCENYGVPQARHRVILLGIRSDINVLPDILKKVRGINMWYVISDLPEIRSECSKRNHKGTTWQNSIREIVDCRWLNNLKGDYDLYHEIKKFAQGTNGPLTTGAEFTEGNYKCKYKPAWFHDKRVRGVCSHSARSHMKTDLHRYIFTTCYAKLNDKSPRIRDFPKSLLPNHKNVANAIEDKIFSDRFKVQIKNKPSSTITSHIAKDGHYYIHPDPKQCRSLTVREAARLQTFPDNYLFEGPRTEQYKQVGNAVPPLLANQIARIVHKIIQDNNLI